MKSADTSPDIPPVSTHGAQLLKAMVGAALLIIGTIATILLYRAGQRAMETRSWTPTPCQIIDARLEEAGDRMTADYRVYLTYRYTTAGADHTGTKWRRITYQGPRADAISRKTSRREEADALLAQYPPGTNAQCHVNPNKPTEAVLEHQTKAPFYTLWWPALFAIGGAGMIRSALRRPSPH